MLRIQTGSALWSAVFMRSIVFRTMARAHGPMACRSAHILVLIPSFCVGIARAQSHKRQNNMSRGKVHVQIFRTTAA